jgi:hypothetical protein
MSLPGNYTSGEQFTAADENAVEAAVNVDTTAEATDASNIAVLQKTIPADYVITVASGTYTATPRAGSGLTAYSGTNFTTVLQNAVTALTPSGGGVGSAGGKIHICKGAYTMGNQVVVTGWEGITGTSNIPHSSLIIEGEGLATQITQNTSGQNAFVVKNLANVSFLDMFGTMGSSALSFILGDNSGAQSEMSFWGGVISVNTVSASTTAPPIYIKNFFDLTVPHLWAFSSAYHGIILENNSSSINYGNSYFGFVRAVAASGTPYAGVMLHSTNTTERLNLITFDNFECNGGYNGVYANGAQNITFNMVDLEANTVCLNLDSGTIGNAQTRVFTVKSGYLLPTSGGTGVSVNVNSGFHYIHAYIDTNGLSVPINDLQQFLNGNEYDIIVPDATSAGRISMASANIHKLRITTGNSYSDFFPAGTSTVTPSSTTDNTTSLATTAWVNTGIPAITHAASSKTTPVSADEIPLADSAASFGLKKLTFANLLAAIPGGVTGSTTPTSSDAAEWDSNLNLSANNVLEGLTSTATSGTAITLTIASSQILYLTGSTAQTVNLPTTSVPKGGDWVVINASTAATTVKSSAGTTVTILSAGTWSTFSALQATPTAGTHWNSLYSGVIAASGKSLTVNNTLTLAGTDGTTMTFPSTSATIARTDAANTFTGVQTMTSPSFTTPVLGTPSSGTLTNCTGLPITSINASTTLALGVGSIELGNASDTTLSRASAGTLAVEGSPVYTQANLYIGVPFTAAQFFRLSDQDPTAAFLMNTATADGNIFISGRTTNLTTLGAYVTTAGSSGAVVRFGLFLLVGATATLITDFGTVAATTSSTFISVTGSAAMVAGQQYMAVAVSQGAPTTKPTLAAMGTVDQWGTQVSASTGATLMTQGIGLRVGGNGAITGALSSGTTQASGLTPCIAGLCAT